jgi:hypothetical protein
MFNEKILDELNPTVDDIQIMHDIIEFCEDIEEDVEEDTYTGDSMQWYLKEIGRIKRLTLEEELELGKEIKEGAPYNICQFTTGKKYNCDLNASYNIGARYFIRELFKETPGLMAEVPETGSGTRRVLADLWHIDAGIRH